MNQVVQDRMARSTSELDLFIRYGPEPDPSFEQIELYRDQLVPVASPALAETLDESVIRAHHLLLSRSDFLCLAEERYDALANQRERAATGDEA